MVLLAVLSGCCSCLPLYSLDPFRTLVCNAALFLHVLIIYYL